MLLHASLLASGLVVTPEMFGAKGDGEADDSKAIVAAVAASEKAQGVLRQFFDHERQGLLDDLVRLCRRKLSVPALEPAARRCCRALHPRPHRVRQSLRGRTSPAPSSSPGPGVD